MFGDITLIMAGLGDYMEELEKLKNKLGTPKVNICCIPPQYVSLFCRCADIMIYPTTPAHCLDARPGACMNASYAGCPIVFPYRAGVLSNGICCYDCRAYRQVCGRRRNDPGGPGCISPGHHHGTVGKK